MPTLHEQYCQAVLDHMWEHSEPGEEEGSTVWKGGLQGMIKSVTPKAHDGKVSTTLRQSDAIQLLQRGGGAQPSIYKLGRHELFQTDEGERVDISSPNWFTSTPLQRLERNYRELANRVRVLENDNEQLKLAVATLSGEYEPLISDGS